jgi:hypothetical protein
LIVNRALVVLVVWLAACSSGPSAVSTGDEDGEKDTGDGTEQEPQRDATVPDARASTVRDAAARRDAVADARTSSGSSECKLGEAGSFATDAMLDLFGQVTYFAKGQALPAGRYRVTYVDGCMKYNAFQRWKVHQNVGLGPDGWYLVGASKAERVALLPGLASDLFGGYAEFEDCVRANKDVPPQEFDFAGGKLGIALNDSPYDDNLTGEQGRNPKWTLTLLVEECPPDLILL